MYSKFLENVIIPLSEFNISKNDSLIYNYKKLKATQWRKPEEIQLLQLKRLKNILQYSKKNIPYYSHLFKDNKFDPESISTINDLKKIPILTKETIRDNFDDLTSMNKRNQNKVIPTSTGGSTGSPLKFFIDHKWQSCNMAAAYRAWNWANYNFGDKTVYLWGAKKDLDKFSNPFPKIYDLLLRTVRLDAFELSDEKLKKYILILKEFNPKIINTYSSAIARMADFMIENDINEINPLSILTTADMLYDTNRKKIKQAFNCDVFDYYSGREVSLQAAECSEHNGYHLSIENAVVEFIKDEEEVSAGETGKLVITDLCNFYMPFIRYEIGDMGIPSDELCTCGRGLPLMEKVIGRSFDYIITPSGNYLTGEYFHFIAIDYKIEGIKDFQIVQESKDKLTVLIVRRKNATMNDVNRYISIIQEKVGEEMEINVEFTDEIEKTPTGKLRHVISKIRKP